MTSRDSDRGLLGKLAVLHAGGLALFLAWRFGGMEPFARSVAAWACLPAPVLTVLALRNASPDLRRAAAWIVVPLLVLTLQVGLSLFNPSRQLYQFWDTPVLRVADHIGWAPSTPWPRATLTDFALNAGLLCVGLNLMFARPPRVWLRGLLWLIALNGLALAVVGTLFRLANADKILGHTASPNPNFFATFVYHNHWGAFALLCAGAALGLALYVERRTAPEPLTRTAMPFLGLAGAILLLSIPLSSARASTIAAAVLALGAAILIGQRLRARLARQPAGAGARRVALIAVAAGTIGFGGFLGYETWSREISQTRAQLADLGAGGIGDARLVIYGDTLKLIRERPVFGWGWQSFQYVYPDVQSELPRMWSRAGRQAVLDAHNDWLQLLAEIGLFGVACLLAAGLGCLRWGGPRRWLRSPQSLLLLVLSSLALLALVDFPLACPAVVLTAACLLGVGAESARGSGSYAGPPTPTISS